MRLPMFLALFMCLSGVQCIADGPNSGVFEVSQFGAQGDGKTDDTTAIRKAIYTASKNGGVVQLGRGKYRITGSLKIESNDVMLKGLGRGISTITADGTDFHGITVGRDDKEVQNIAISDLTVERPQQAKAEIANIFFVRTRYSSMDNLSISNGGDGIFIGSRTAQDITGCVSLKRIWLGGCRRCLVVATAADITVDHMYGGHTDTGVYLTQGANNIRLTDSVFLTARPTQGKHGLLSDSGFMQEVKGCVFEETSEEVIKVTNLMRFYFHDNWLNANPDRAMIRFEKVNQFSIRNTRYGGSGTRCVELDHSSRGDVSGNSMESSRGIAVNVIGGDNLEIFANQMGGNDVCGIRLSDGAQCVRIAGNHITGYECAIHLTDTVGDKLIIKENFLAEGKKGAILDESKIKTKIIGDNLPE